MPGGWRTAMLLGRSQTFLATLSLLGLLTISATAQPAPPAGKPEMAENNCPGLVANGLPLAKPVAFRTASLASDQVRISYTGHSTFLIESPRGVKIATDYND